MTFNGFERSALAELDRLPHLDASGYASRRELLGTGLITPARALLSQLVRGLAAPLTTSPRGSFSPLHTDLRFAPPGAPRYKDHLLLTAWHGHDKKSGPTLWLRLDSTTVGFASGLPFTPAVRDRWRAAVGGPRGELLAAQLGALRSRHAGHDVEVAGERLRRVASPWTDEHPRADLLRMTGFQVRFRLPLPREVEGAAFVPWCIAYLDELLPTHRWLVNHLYEGSDSQ